VPERPPGHAVRIAQLRYRALHGKDLPGRLFKLRRRPPLARAAWSQTFSFPPYDHAARATLGRRRRPRRPGFTRNPECDDCGGGRLARPSDSFRSGSASHEVRRRRTLGGVHICTVRRVIVQMCTWYLLVVSYRARSRHHVSQTPFNPPTAHSQLRWLCVSLRWMALAFFALKPAMERWNLRLSA